MTDAIVLYRGGATPLPVTEPMGWWSSRRISEHIT